MTATLIGQRLREARKRRGLTQVEMARRTGIHQPNIARLEAGRHTPALETLERLATAIGCPLAELLGAEDSRVAWLLQEARRLLSTLDPKPGSALDGVDELVFAVLRVVEKTRREEAR